jgi:hypothetical protein
MSNQNDNQQQSFRTLRTNNNYPPQQEYINNQQRNIEPRPQHKERGIILFFLF